MNLSSPPGRGGHSSNETETFSDFDFKEPTVSPTETSEQNSLAWRMARRSKYGPESTYPIGRNANINIAIKKRGRSLSIQLPSDITGWLEADEASCKPVRLLDGLALMQRQEKNEAPRNLMEKITRQVRCN